MTPKCAKCGREIKEGIYQRIQTGEKAELALLCRRCAKKWLNGDDKRPIGPTETKGGNDGKEATGDGTTV